METDSCVHENSVHSTVESANKAAKEAYKKSKEWNANEKMSVDYSWGSNPTENAAQPQGHEETKDEMDFSAQNRDVTYNSDGGIVICIGGEWWMGDITVTRVPVQGTEDAQMLGGFGENESEEAAAQKKFDSLKIQD